MPFTISISSQSPCGIGEVVYTYSLVNYFWKGIVSFMQILAPPLITSVALKT